MSISDLRRRRTPTSASAARSRHQLVSALVAAATLASGAVYVLTSQELRFELSDVRYKNTLIGQFIAGRGLGGVRLLHPVDVGGVLLLAVFVLCCVATAFAARRAFGSTRGRSTLWALGVSAAVVPALLLATILWPDGGGALGSLQILAATSLLAFVFASVVALRGDGAFVPVSTPRSNPDERDPGRRWAWVFIALLVPLAIATWWNGIDAVRGFDSLADHLPRAARWLHVSRLSEESGELLTPYYPGNFQILVRWILVLGTDAYAFLPSFLASILALGAIYGICREIGQARWTAIVSTTTAASCSLVAYLATTVEADVVMTAFLLLAVLLLLRWLRTMRPPELGDIDPRYDAAALVGIGASLGLAVGTKYSAMPTAVVLALVVAYYAWRAAHGALASGERFFNARTVLAMLAAVAISGLACAGYWYVRNTVRHGNPLYPVSTLGLPGVDLKYIIPVKAALESSSWKRATYPWVQWDFVSVYDDGLGAVFATVALIGFAVIPFRRPARPSRRRLVWFITAAAFVLWLGTGSITARFGLFPVLLTFVFVGELWRDFESVALKLVTLVAFGVSVLVTTRSLIAGAVYTTLMPPGSRGVPSIVDSLPAARIFNATSAANRYALLGRDYRHEVITMFREAVPRDVAGIRPSYVLLAGKQVPAFTAAVPLTLIERGPAVPGVDTLSLWRVGGTDSAAVRPPDR